MLWVSQVSVTHSSVMIQSKKYIFVLPVAVGAIKMHLVRESKWAHSRFRDASTAFPGVTDRKAYAAIFQPPTVTLVIFLKSPSGVKLTDQRQLSSLTFTCMSCLLEGKRPWYEEDRACEGRRRHIKITTSQQLIIEGFCPNFPGLFQDWWTFSWLPDRFYCLLSARGTSPPLTQQPLTVSMLL